jgi:hypothetical protein
MFKIEALKLKIKKEGKMIEIILLTAIIILASINLYYQYWNLKLLTRFIVMFVSLIGGKDNQKIITKTEGKA